MDLTDLDLSFESLVVVLVCIYIPSLLCNDLSQGWNPFPGVFSDLDIWIHNIWLLTPWIPYLAQKYQGYCTVIHLWPTPPKRSPNKLKHFWSHILTVLISPEPRMVMIFPTYMLKGWKNIIKNLNKWQEYFSC